MGSVGVMGAPAGAGDGVGGGGRSWQEGGSGSRVGEGKRGGLCVWGARGESPWH